MSDAGRAADAAAAAATAMPSSKTTLDFLSSQSPFLSRYLFMHSRSFRVFSTAILFDDDTTDLLRCCLPCALSLSRSLYLFLSLSLSAAHWHPLLKLIKPIYKSFDREVAIYLSAREHDYKFTPYAQRPAWAHNSWRRRRYIFSTKRALAARRQRRHSFGDFVGCITVAVALFGEKQPNRGVKWQRYFIYLSVCVALCCCAVMRRCICYMLRFVRFNKK